MAKNARNEMRGAVMRGFREGINKHEMKMERGNNLTLVASYGTRNDLLDKASDFGHYLAKEGVKHASDVQKANITDYLDQKASEGCTQRTVDAYRSAISRIGNLLGRDWSVDRVQSSVGKAPDRGVDSVISARDYAKILDYARANPSRSGECIRLEREIGVRVGDLAYGVRVNEDRLEIRSKNGRICEREITPEVRSIIDSPVFKSMMRGDRLDAPKDASINTYLRRVEDKLGLERHSFHDLRRYGAQEKYDMYRNSGMGRSEALSCVSQWLNHGSNRDDMIIRAYVRAW